MSGEAEARDVKPPLPSLLPHNANPRWVEEPRDQARTDFFEELAEHCDLTMEAAVWRYTRAPEPSFTLNHPMTPDPGMEHAFPLRDPADPMRVHPRYADPSGAVDRRVAVLDVQPPSGPLKYLMRLCGIPTAKHRRLCEQLANDVRAEMERLVRGRRESPRYEVRQLRAVDVREHESVLIGQHGLFAWPDESPERRPILDNGRVVGLFVGALLETPAEEAAYAQSHPGYTSYMVSFRRSDGRMAGLTGLGATNGPSFANTALLPGTPARYDHEWLNCHLMPFQVRLTNAQGKPSRATVVALVAMASAYGPGNPTREFRVDYGPHFLTEFDERWAARAEGPIEIKQEMDVDPPDEPLIDPTLIEDISDGPEPEPLRWASQETAQVMEGRLLALASPPPVHAALLEVVEAAVTQPVGLEAPTWAQAAMVVRADTHAHESAILAVPQRLDIRPAPPKGRAQGGPRPLLGWQLELMRAVPRHPFARESHGAYARRLMLVASLRGRRVSTEDLMVMAGLRRGTALSARRLGLHPALIALMRQHPQESHESDLEYARRLCTLGADVETVRSVFCLPPGRGPYMASGRSSAAASSRHDGVAPIQLSSCGWRPESPPEIPLGGEVEVHTTAPVEAWLQHLPPEVRRRVLLGWAPPPAPGTLESRNGHARRLAMVAHGPMGILEAEDLMVMAGVGAEVAEVVRYLPERKTLAMLMGMNLQRPSESDEDYALRLKNAGAPQKDLNEMFQLNVMRLALKRAMRRAAEDLSGGAAHVAPPLRRQPRMILGPRAQPVLKRIAPSTAASEVAPPPDATP